MSSSQAFFAASSSTATEEKDNPISSESRIRTLQSILTTHIAKYIGEDNPFPTSTLGKMFDTRAAGKLRAEKLISRLMEFTKDCNLLEKLLEDCYAKSDGELLGTSTDLRKRIGDALCEYLKIEVKTAAKVMARIRQLWSIPLPIDFYKVTNQIRDPMIKEEINGYLAAYMDAKKPADAPKPKPAPPTLRDSLNEKIKQFLFKTDLSVDERQGVLTVQFIIEITKDDVLLDKTNEIYSRIGLSKVRRCIDEAICRFYGISEETVADLEMKECNIAWQKSKYIDYELIRCISVCHLAKTALAGDNEMKAAPAPVPKKSASTHGLS
ncbi:MAG TPA: hypothetical protein VLI69_01265 [Gammaproteobacteria bacterium]|nr:hypothetical protein [Gammaproteobacteria bacterium]